ncbi:MAG TPA: hypothetical protein VKR83_20155 [Ktedonobacteraceae bacterium]|nr:hypothetical protein [Ktedonobacteraceae bacterium]
MIVIFAMTSATMKVSCIGLSRAMVMPYHMHAPARLWLSLPWREKGAER